MKMLPFAAALWMARAGRCALAAGAMSLLLPLLASTALAAPARLVIHADDLGMAHSVDEAAFAALERGEVTSASVMVPAPWFPEVAAWARSHPDADLGIHLTMTSEWGPFRWGSAAPRDQVPSLLDPNGYLWPDADSFAAHAKPAEVGLEIAAQIDRALAAGIKPTHLDCHMGALYRSPELLGALIQASRSTRIPFFAARVPGAPAELFALLGPADVVFDSMAMLGPADSGDPAAFYDRYVGSRGPGLHMLIVHPGRDDAELQAVTGGLKDYGAAWRAADARILAGASFRNALRRARVSLIGWKALRPAPPVP